MPVARCDITIDTDVVAQCGYRTTDQENNLSHIWRTRVCTSPLWLLLLFTALKMFSVPHTGLLPRHMVHLELLGQLL